VNNLSSTSRCLLFIALLAVPLSAGAQNTGRLMSLFNKLAQKGDDKLNREGPDAAIEFYEDALLDPVFENFGRIHLRMAQIHQEEGRYADAMYHFEACIEDKRVDEIDRNFICKGGLEEVSAPLEIMHLPRDARVFILEPRMKNGPFDSGDRLPLGWVELTVEAPGHHARNSRFEHRRNTPWEARLGMRLRDGQIVPDGFISGGDGDDEVDPMETMAPTGPSGASNWPIYLTAGVGAALIGSGIGVGLNNQAAFEDTRATQAAGTCLPMPQTFPCGQSITEARNRAVLADTLWISGTAVVTSALVWWLFRDDDPQEEGAP